MTGKYEKCFADNLKSWNAVAQLHAQGSGAEFYRIEEFLHLLFRIRKTPWEDVFEPVIPNYWKLKDGFVPLPMSYSLRARKRC